MGSHLPGANNNGRTKRRRRRLIRRRSCGDCEDQRTAGDSSDDAERPNEPAGTGAPSASTGPKEHNQPPTGAQRSKTPSAGGTKPASGVAGKATEQLNPLQSVSQAKKGLDAAKTGDVAAAGKQATAMAAKAVAAKAGALIAAKVGLPVAALLVILLVLAMVFVPIVHQVRSFAHENQQARAAVDYVSGAWDAVTDNGDTSSQAAFTPAGNRDGLGGLGDLPDGVPGDLVSIHLQIGAAQDLPWWILAAVAEVTTSHGAEVGDDHSRESRSELFPAMVPPVEVTDDDSTWVGPYLIDSEPADNPDRLQRHDASMRQIAAWLQTLLRDTSRYHPDRAFIHDDQKHAWVEAIAGLPLQPLVHEHDSQQLAEEIYQLAYDWYHLGNACPPHERQRGPVEIGDGDLEGLPDHDPIEVGDEFSIYGGALTEEHLENAEIIVGVGQDHDLPPRAWAIALATAIIESQLVNVPGGDRDSLGLFQQRPGTGWGDPEDIMDPVKSSEAFYGVADHLPGGGNKGLLQIESTSCPTCEPPNPHPVGTPWEEWDPGHAAQAVQISGHPTRYDQNMAMAVGVLKTVLDGEIPTGFDDCDEDDDEDDRRRGVEWACPIDTTVTSPYGPRGGRMHQGTDFGGTEGQTPIVATKDGTVHAATGYGGYGQTVVIDHGDDTSSLYAHMPVGGMDVSRGDEVGQGERIGVVGNTGRSTGPHLHFEIREGIGVESGDPVDPQPLLGLPSGSAAVGMECPERDDEPLPPPDWGGQTESDPSGTGGLVVPQLAHLYHETEVFFPGVHEVFGTFCYAPRPPGSPQGHPEGRACDIMLAPLGQMASSDARALGDDVAQWYVDHADILGVDMVIWWGEIWTDRRRSEGWRPYSTSCSTNVTLGHCDHVHVEVPRGDRPPRIPDP